jgi:hypothetical protein
MKSRFTKVLLAFVLSLAILIPSGCSASSYQKAEVAYTIIQTVLTTAQGELPLLVATGAITPSDAGAVGSYIGLGLTFNGNYNTCIANAQSTTLNTAGKFTDCIGVLAASFAAPSTLATLRIVSAKGQSKAQAIVAAVVGGINIGLAAFKAANVAVPVVAPVTAETQAEIDNFHARVIDNLPPRLHRLALANGY